MTQNDLWFASVPLHHFFNCLEASRRSCCHVRGSCLRENERKLACSSSGNELRLRLIKFYFRVLKTAMSLCLHNTLKGTEGKAHIAKQAAWTREDLRPEANLLLW